MYENYENQNDIEQFKSDQNTSFSSDQRHCTLHNINYLGQMLDFFSSHFSQFIETYFPNQCHLSNIIRSFLLQELPFFLIIISFCFCHTKSILLLVLRPVQVFNLHTKTKLTSQLKTPNKL